MIFDPSIRMIASRSRIFLMVLVFMMRGPLLFGQTVQWASEVVAFSSEFKDKNKSPRYRAIQILGKPNAMPQGGENPCAWSPKRKSRLFKEYIIVGFKSPMQIKQVAVAESHNCGTIVGITLIDDQGKYHKIQTQSSCGPDQNSNMHRVIMPLTDYKVKEVIVYMKTKRTDGWNHIDAIGISDSDDPIKAEINEVTHNEDLKLEILSTNVNSEWDELKPMISPDGKHLFIVRKGHPENIGTEGNDDVWISDKRNGEWGPAINAGTPLNNKDHNYVNGVSPDGNVVLLGNIYGTNGNKGKGLSISNFRNGEWSFPTPLNIQNYYNYSKYMEAHISGNLNTIVMAVWRKETYGNKDLYVIFNQGDNNWTEPKNLGPLLNTASDEIAPFLAPDGKTLYFSSSGFSGYGGYDIYMTHRLDDTWQNWSEPVNMGPVINSEGWDAYLSLDAEGEYAFLSRKNESSTTETDIYRVHLDEAARPEKMQVVEVRLNGMKDDEQALLSYASVQRTDLSGIAYSKKDENGHVVHFTANMDGQFMLIINVPGYKSIKHELNVAENASIEFTLEPSQ